MKQSRMNNLTKYLLRLTALAAVGLCVFLSSACGKDEKSGVRVINSISARNMITSPVNDKALHFCCTKESLQLVCASGLLELYVDPVTNSFAVFEVSKDCMWSALPLNISNAAMLSTPLTDAAMVSLKIAEANGDILYLNSQDDSVGYSTASYEIIGSTDGKTGTGIKFTYNICADKESGEKLPANGAKPGNATKDLIAFRVTVSVELIDGSLFVGCDYSNIYGNNNVFIEELTLLNYFGAYGESYKNDFVLVPDGCGAIIKTAISDDSFESLSFPVYGSDASLGDNVSSSGAAVVGAFGIKHGESAFVALVERGTAIATIKADKAVSTGEYNTVYSSFNITPVVYEDETLYISDSSYHKDSESEGSDISMCYRFVSGKNATYGGLASACREQLIRNATLSTGQITADSALPFNLSVTGCVPTNLIGNFGYMHKLTALDDAQDMLIRLKSKGVNNINMRIEGAFDGGINSKEICSSGLLKRLGGSEALSELYEYTSAQNMGLFLDVNLLTSSSGFSAAHSAAKNIYHNDSNALLSNPFGDDVGSDSYTRSLRNLSNIGSVISKVLGNTRYYSFSGYCLNDIGTTLYSDFSSNGMNREKSANAIAAVLPPLATNRTTMAVCGNFYMLRNIDVIVDMPLKTSVSQSGAYLSVPFIQIILHGIVDYSGEPFNSSVNYDETLLRCIEYGACPYYEWNYIAVADNPDKDIYYWDNSINEAVELYTTVNKVLGDLRGARITDHFEVADGVFCTEYDNGAMVYVNYTNSDYQNLGAVVNARSYIRIN